VAASDREESRDYAKLASCITSITVLPRLHNALHTAHKNGLMYTTSL
jgi:hypothetical protein